MWRVAMHVAVVGATGLVGQALLTLLHQRAFPVERVYAIASPRSSHASVSFASEHTKVHALDQFDFSSTQLVFFTAGSQISQEYVPKAVQQGAIVIDNTSCFRSFPDIPLIVPEVNASVLDSKRHPIIANPNCSTTQMVVVLKPIHDAVGVRRVNVATYQSVSGAGRRALNELDVQIQDHESAPCVLPAPIAFNVIPQIDVWMDNAYTKEEMKMFWETQKILNDSRILVNATAVRVPVRYGHALAVHLETAHPISPEDVQHLLEQAPGVWVMSNSAYPTPREHAPLSDSVFVGRIRKDVSHPLGINLWIVANNLFKGGALNAVQIAEYLLEHHKTLYF